MPGLSQLKQFNKDLLSLGDELTIRASRGEKPVQVIIPKDIEDINDSEDFVLGMPQIEAEVEAAPIDEDLSDLAGLTSTPTASGNSEPVATFEAPDLSSLLNPISVPDDASAGMDMPDLSMFEEPEEQEEEIVEEEPEEVSIADMGLDALLAGGGFDAPEEEAQEEPEPEKEPLSIDDFKEVENFDTLDEELEEVEDIPSAPADDGLSELERDLFASLGTESTPAEATKGEPSLDDLLGNLDLDKPSESDNLDNDSIDDLSPADELQALSEDFSADDSVAPAEELTDFGFLDNLEPAASTEDVPDTAAPEEDFGLDDLATETPAEDFGLDDLATETPAEDFGLDNLTAESPAEDFGLDDLAAEAPTEDFGLDDLAAETPAEDFGLDDLAAESPAEAFGLDDLAAETPAEDFGLDDLATEAPAEDFGLDNLAEPVIEENITETDAGENISDLGDLGDFDLPEVPETTEETSDESDAVTDFDLDSLGDLGDSDFDSLAENAGNEENLETETPAENFGLDDFASEAPSENFGLDDFAAETPVETPAENENDAATEALLGGLGDFDLPEDNSDNSDASESFGLDDMDFGSSGADAVSFDAEDEIPDYGDESEESGDDGESSDSLEVFDTSEMEGMDFGIPDTDAQLDGAGSDFELGGSDDFAMEGEFEIPGFSDVQTAKEEKSASGLASKNSKGKKGRGKNLPEPDFSDAEESEDLPPNTLSDVQYKQFLKNLGEYPLNVRLAFEDFIVQDEFTDDAEFEVIEKILNKAPARQVASMLEKMLDISIPVPRDFEHRTAEEYEAYKKSLSYQLKNKIIPGILVGIVTLLVMWGIFNFTKNCIYKPLKANKLYKQGYALLEADEYPQSEMKFEEAVSYRINKKWFFNYARGYRSHRQYQRAGSMYERILKYYKHDKTAGLEYADMELNNLANYKRAEEIVRREVLDYHINDSDGILMLGDIFLEWGTEKEPAMLESAREQYATLLQLYGSTDLYLSRMMRYFIRTDNLRQVIQMKNTFEPREKSLGGSDWTELSGYLLEKYYGPLAPSDEYLRYEIEGLRGLLLRAVKTDASNPIALYNLAKYFIQSGENSGIERTLQTAIEKFNTIQSMKKRDIYKYIDSYRLLGEYYIDTTDFLQAQEQFAEGISLYTTERDNAGFEGNADVGKLYADMGNIKYTISGDYDEALMNYKYSVELENDTPSIRYRIGYIQYKNKNYVEALGSFMKAGDGNVKQRNLLLAMANTLSLRGDDYAAQGYYNQLIDSLDLEIAKRGVVFPQASIKDYDVVNTYLSAANNYGVTLYKLAKRTGNSGLNAQAIVQFQQSLRAWDSLTRNQETMVRLAGSNLAEQNIQYITHPVPEFEPAIYTDIAKTLMDNEHL